MARFLAVFDFPDVGPGHPEDNERERLAFEDSLRRGYSAFPKPEGIKVLYFRVCDFATNPIVVLPLSEFNELLKQAKAANNYLHEPAVSSGEFRAEMLVTGHEIYRAIVAVEDTLRKDHRLRWGDGRWEPVPRPR